MPNKFEFSSRLLTVKEEVPCLQMGRYAVVFFGYNRDNCFPVNSLTKPSFLSWSQVFKYTFLAGDPQDGCLRQLPSLGATMCNITRIHINITRIHIKL